MTTFSPWSNMGGVSSPGSRRASATSVSDRFRSPKWLWCAWWWLKSRRHMGTPWHFSASAASAMRSRWSRWRSCGCGPSLRRTTGLSFVVFSFLCTVSKPCTGQYLTTTLVSSWWDGMGSSLFFATRSSTRASAWRIAAFSSAFLRRARSSALAWAAARSRSASCCFVSRWRSTLAWCLSAPSRTMDLRARARGPGRDGVSS
mmetsp:Transcript_18622/g.64649  ORF Transcript_18622/g.64649 Transcript_18622/m.64649 type:complete len:202 (+) Transcript_18622:331-936(+)